MQKVNLLLNTSSQVDAHYSPETPWVKVRQKDHLPAIGLGNGMIVMAQRRGNQFSKVLPQLLSGLSQTRENISKTGKCDEETITHLFNLKLNCK